MRPQALPERASLGGRHLRADLALEGLGELLRVLQRHVHSESLGRVRVGADLVLGDVRADVGAPVLQ